MEFLEEYIVTVKDSRDLESLYEDMESPGGNLYIPDRNIACANRRSISRNTHYMLSKDEADLVRRDPRIMSVEKLPSKLGVKVTRNFIQEGTVWDKSFVNNSSHKNWGILRCYEGEQRPNWGYDGVSLQSGTVKTTSEGKNVDIVIVDGFMDPTHPEFSVNSDGTGGSRVIQYNWFQHNPAVRGIDAGVYDYTRGTSNFAISDDNHGAHVAGTAAGNTQGWARKANIYNINPYSTDPSNTYQDSEIYLIDYIREFHKNKPINPETGRKNPTICNHSWGYTYTLSVGAIIGVYYRGQFVSEFTTEELTSLYGIRTRLENGILYAILPFRYAAVDQDMVDAMNEGIIMVGAAANDRTKIDVPEGDDHGNIVVFPGPQPEQLQGVLYHQGSSPAAASDTICVGAVSGTVSESKAEFSNCGPRVDVYAPGENIISSLNTGSMTDPRNSSYFLGKYDGTSMASPQVCGVLACALETYPNLSQSAARSYIEAHSKTGQMLDTSGSYSDYTSLQGSPNRYLCYKKERKDIGSVYPSLTYFVRPTSSMTFPRVKIRRKG